MAFDTDYERSVAQSLDSIAKSLAIATRVCFCGHNLETHAPACVIHDCTVNCKEFNPPLLAISRGLNHLVMQFVDFKMVMAAATGQMQQPQSPIITPGNLH